MWYYGICDSGEDYPSETERILNQDGWKITTQGTIQNLPDIFWRMLTAL